MASSEVDDEFAKGSSEFAMILYTKLRQSNSGENIIFSPFSIQTCLALVHAGAAGTTADEIATGLCLPSKDRTAIAKTFEDILNVYKDNSLLKIANKIYVNIGYELMPEFNEIVIKSFHSEVQNVDFANGQAAADTINSWVESKTNNKIKKLFEPGSLSENSCTVLINAIYFKGNWIDQFDKELTEKDKFYINEEDTVEVDMMTMECSFKYGELENLDATALELPYNNSDDPVDMLPAKSVILYGLGFPEFPFEVPHSDMSMLIVLPNKRTGLKDLEEKLCSINLADLTNEMRYFEVNVKLPRFKIEFSTELTEPLKQLGINEIFDYNANFSNLLKTSKPLKVNKIVHKAFIEVNEEGTEAAAATAADDDDDSGPLQIIIKDFEVNRPFLFVLKSDRAVIFIGRVVNPNNNITNNNNNQERCNCHKRKQAI